jgi:glycosyltransferase involved in cell wall biosynthesis
LEGIVDIYYIVESGGLCGGVRVIYEHAVRLQARGHKVTIASLDKPPLWFDLGGVKWLIFKDYLEMKLALEKLRGKKIATWWKTAPVVRDISENGEGYYFIQDIETSYYWRRIEREWVTQTYQYGLKHYTDEKWVADNMPGTVLVGQAYDAGLYKPMAYVYPQARRVIACMRRQALKGFGELGEFSRRLFMARKDIELVTFGLDAGSVFGGSFSRHFKGMPDSDLVRLYSEGTVHISTSLHEGFGLTLLEAMACGCAVATFDADGNYFCEDGVNCRKVEKGNVEGLVGAVVEIIEDAALRKRLVQGGLETAKQFADWTPVVDRVEKFLLA